MKRYSFGHNILNGFGHLYQLIFKIVYVDVEKLIRVNHW